MCFKNMILKMFIKKTRNLVRTIDHQFGIESPLSVCRYIEWLIDNYVKDNTGLLSLKHELKKLETLGLEHKQIELYIKLAEARRLIYILKYLATMKRR